MDYIKRFLMLNICNETDQSYNISGEKVPKKAETDV